MFKARLYTTYKSLHTNVNKYFLTYFWWGNLRERDHWGGSDVDWRIILRRIFRNWEGVVGTGWSWLRIGRGGGHL
jgi:hypothetical protein